MATRVRGFVFTLNNYSEEEYSALIETAHAQAKYYIFGKEVAPSTGTPHIQGYIYWKNGKTIDASRKLLPRRVANHEPAKGTPDQNYIYCSKEGNFETNMPVPKPKNTCCRKLNIRCYDGDCYCGCRCDQCYLKRSGFKTWEELRAWERELIEESKKMHLELIEKYGEDYAELEYDTDDD